MVVSHRASQQPPTEPRATRCPRALDGLAHRATSPARPARGDLSCRSLRHHEISAVSEPLTEAADLSEGNDGFCHRTGPLQLCGAQPHARHMPPSLAPGTALPRAPASGAKPTGVWYLTVLVHTVAMESISRRQINTPLRHRSVWSALDTELRLAPAGSRITGAAAEPKHTKFCKIFGRGPLFGGLRVGAYSTTDTIVSIIYLAARAPSNAPCAACPVQHARCTAPASTCGFYTASTCGFYIASSFLLLMLAAVAASTCRAPLHVERPAPSAPWAAKMEPTRLDALVEYKKARRDRTTGTALPSRRPLPRSPQRATRHLPALPGRPLVWSAPIASRMEALSCLRGWRWSRSTRRVWPGPCPR